MVPERRNEVSLQPEESLQESITTEKGNPSRSQHLP